MNGLEAIFHAVSDAGVELVTYVPGYPINEVAQALGAQICVNEKVALEMALGSSATGARSMVVVKQVGMNILADPMVIAATHGIGSGIVVLAGDDLGPKSSQTEMDSRYYGQIAELPVLDPRDPDSLYSSLLEAYDLSHSLRIPVIVRITSRLMTSAGPVSTKSASLPSPQLYDRSSWDLTARGRHQRHHGQVMQLAEATSEKTPLNSLRISGDFGIIASGYPASLVEGMGTSLLIIGYAHPLPWKLITKFISDHTFVLVAEEPEPFIEGQLVASLKVKGRLTGHLPYGPLERSDLEQAIKEISLPGRHQVQGYETAKKRGSRSLCDDCPYLPLFRVLRRLEVPVSGDAGCSILATREPFRAVDVVYGLGSSIGVASGFRRKGIAVIGDFAFAHSGLLGLINAVWCKRNVLVVLLKNDVAATTGGQEVPDLSFILETLVPTRRLSMPASEDVVEQMLQEELSSPRASAVVAEGRCTRYG